MSSTRHTRARFPFGAVAEPSPHRTAVLHKTGARSQASQDDSAERLVARDPRDGRPARAMHPTLRRLRSRPASASRRVRLLARGRGSAIGLETSRAVSHRKIFEVVVERRHATAQQLGILSGSHCHSRLGSRDVTVSDAPLNYPPQTEFRVLSRGEQRVAAVMEAAHVVGVAAAARVERVQRDERARLDREHVHAAVVLAA